MFNGCSNLTNVNLSNLNLSNVKSADKMFMICNNLTTIVTPQLMELETYIDLPAAFYDSQKNIVTKITSVHCNKTLTKKPINYTITYYLNGGINTTNNPTSYTIETANIKLQNPTKTGYTFGGWYSDNKYTKKVITIPTGSTGNKKFYAKWTANKYHIAFRGNGSTSGTMKTVSNCNYGSTYTLKTNTYKRTGYTFAGWNTKANGTGTTYRNAAKIKNLTTSNGRTIILYAQWKPVKYSIRYSLGTGKNHRNNPTTYTVATSTIKLQTPTRTGYNFKGWYSNSKYKIVVKTITKGSTGNKVLYAKWIKK